jgi:hypothetical protein
MPYAFRLRFHIADRSQLNIDAEEWQVPIAGTDVRLSRGETKAPLLSNSRRVVMIGRGYESEVAARAAAYEWRNTLIIAMARSRIGVDIGGRLPTSQFLPHGFSFVGAHLGINGPVLDDVHGISVFEQSDPWPKFSTMNVVGRFGIVAETAARVLTTAYANRAKFRDKDAVAFDFFNLAYFQERAETRLVSLVIAIEALAGEPARQAPHIRTSVANLIRHTRHDSALSPQERRNLSRQLCSLGNETIIKTCRRLVKERLGNRKYGGASARDFLMTAYSYRSRIVHGGDIPSESEIRNLLGDLERFASDLLTLPLVGEE